MKVSFKPNKLDSRALLLPHTYIAHRLSQSDYVSGIKKADSAGQRSSCRSLVFEHRKDANFFFICKEKVIFFARSDFLGKISKAQHIHAELQEVVPYGYVVNSITLCVP